MGDFNSAADRSVTATYGNLVGAGFADVWDRANPADPGYTCCHAEDLLNSEPDLDRRIDLIFIRPVGTGNPVRRTVNAAVVGEEHADRTASGLWPAEHASVWAAFRLQ